MGRKGNSRVRRGADTPPPPLSPPQLAALIPATCWYPAVGAVATAAWYVTAAVALGSATLVGLWYAFRTIPMLLALSTGLACGALVAGGFWAGVPPVGTVAAAVAAALFFSAVEGAAPPPVAAAVTAVGLAAGGIVFTWATALLAPVWATDAAVGRAGSALDALAAMAAAEPGGRWCVQERAGGVEAAPVEAPADADADATDAEPDALRPAGGEPTRPRAPGWLRRRRRAARARVRAGDAEAGKGGGAGGPPPPPRRPLPKPRPPGAAPRAGVASLPPVEVAWVALDAALGVGAACAGAARGEAYIACCRLMLPWAPPLARLHFHLPTAALAEVGAAAQAAARVVWCLHSLADAPLPPPASALVLAVYGGMAPVHAVADAAVDAARAIAAACPRRFRGGGGGGGPVASAELASLKDAIAALDTKRAAAAAGDPAVARLLAASADADAAASAHEARFSGWEITLAPLLVALERCAVAVAGLEGGLPR